MAINYAEKYGSKVAELFSHASFVKMHTNGKLDFTGNKTLKIYMAREDIANLSNMTTSNAIRTLSAFVSEKIITVDGRRIKIINEPALRKISKFG